MNPIVEILADAKTDRLRAAWFLGAPLCLFLTDTDDIVRVCRLAGFRAGEDYAGEMRAVLASVRKMDTGGLKQGACEIFDRANGLMEQISGGVA